MWLRSGFGAGQGGWSCFPGKGGKEGEKPHVEGESASDGAAGTMMRMEQQPGKAGTLCWGIRNNLRVCGGAGTPPATGEQECGAQFWSGWEKRLLS